MALKLGELTAFLVADDKRFKEGLDKAKKHFDGWGGKLKLAAAAAGAAIGAAVATGISGAMDLESARTRLANQLGDEALAGELGAAAGAAYGRGFGDSAATAMDAARALMQGGLLSPDADRETMEQLTVKALALADTFGLDVTQAARAAGQMIRTGMAGDAEEAFDVLTRGFQTTGDLAGDLLDTVTEYGTKFRDLGLDGRQAMGLISQGLQAGARDTDKVADALKEFAIRAIDGSTTTAEGFELLGLKAEEMAAKIAAGGPEAAAALDLTLDRLRAIEDPVQRDAAAVALFGTQAEDLGDALYALDPSSAVDALGEVEGAAAEMADTMEQDAAQQLEGLKRSAQQALVEQLGRAVPHIRAVAEWLGRNSDIVGPLVAILGGLAGIIGTILGVYKAWIALQTALNIVMSLNPIGLIVLAIVGLIAVIVLLWQHSETFRNIVTGVWQAVWGAIQAVWGWIKDTLWPGIQAVWDGIVNAAKVVWEGIKKYFGFWKGVLDAVINWVVSVKDRAVENFNRVVDFVKGLPGRIKSAASGMWDGIKDAFRNALNWIIDRWNGLSFTVGPISMGPLGQMGPWTMSTPDLPRLARGGIVPATPGGRLAVVGEGGQDEAVIPLTRLENMLRDALSGEMVAVVPIDLGEGITQVVEMKLRRRDRDLRRRVLAGAGGAR